MCASAPYSRLVAIALRLLAVLLLALPLAPHYAVGAQQVQPQANICPERIRLAGPADGSPGRYYTYTATVDPASAGPGLTIQWEVTDHTVAPHAGNSDSQEFTWTSGGVKTVRVSASVMDPLCRETVSAEIEVYIAPLPLSDVPLDVYRLAAQLLEEQRAVSPNWADASFTAPSGEGEEGSVTPLYRPDIAGPAYYEFQVYGPDPNTLRGYIIVSTGDHDHPITNWSTGWDYGTLGTPQEDVEQVGWSPTRRLRAESGWQADKFFKLDVLSYAAEDGARNLVARWGDLPPKVTLPDGWAENPPSLVTTNTVPVLTPGIDELLDQPPVQLTEVITPTVAGEPVLGAWESWAALKAGYATTYAPFLEALAQSAAPEWDALAIQREYGYVLRRGESVAYPLLPSVTGIAHDGDAYTGGLIAVDPAPGDPAPALIYTAEEALFNQGVPMTTTVTYDGGAQERIRVMVVSEPQHWVNLPLVAGGSPSAGAGASAAAGSAAAWIAPAWNAPAWNAADAAAPLPAGEVAPLAYTPGILAADGYAYWFVGGTQAAADAQQAWYKQFDEDLACKSGCGPTAWAMLIAWGDRQADSADNSFWAGRTGLYRNNGGHGDPTVVAPRWWDDTAQGEGVRNMIKEIRQWVYTFCNAFNDSGATQPFTMHLVGDYLNGRTGVNVRTWYLPAGFSVTGSDGDAVRTAARNVLQNEGDTRRPTVIGTGFLSHYPLAYGYRQKTQQVCTTDYKLVNGKMTWVTNCMNQLLKGFYVNQGWGEVEGEWVSTDIWFNGRLTPQPAGANDIGLYSSADDRYYFDPDHDLENTFSFQYAGGTLPYAVRPVVGDFDRDGVLDDLAHFVRSDYWQSSRQQDWYIDIDTNASIEMILDRPIRNHGGWPLVLDHDRDGFVDDIAVYAPDTYSYGYMCYTDYCQGYGTGGDYRLPVSGDFDRDGDHDDVAFYSQANRSWAFDMDHDGDWDGSALGWPPAAQVGENALPFAGDLDLDGVVDDIGLFDPAYQKWWFDYNRNGSTDDWGTGFGQAGDLPFVGSFWLQ